MQAGPLEQLREGSTEFQEVGSVGGKMNSVENSMPSLLFKTRIFLPIITRFIFMLTP